MIKTAPRVKLLSEPAVSAGGGRVRSRLKTLATLTLLLLALPFNLTLVSIALLRSLVLRQAQSTTVNPQTVLISGGKMTKALQLARSFHKAGHRVILVEMHKYWLTGHRFSRCVDRFYTIPKPQSSQYAQALLEIVQKENVTVYVPVCSPVASYYDALIAEMLAPHCTVMHVDVERLKQLDDKYAFAIAAGTLGLSVPKSHRITHPQQVIDFDFSKAKRPYILKSIPYDSVRRLHLTQLPLKDAEETATFVRSLPISEANPWIMQEYIPGQEYCTHSTVRQGHVQLHCCCKSSAFQVNYEQVDHSEIERWILAFVKGLNLTGQVSFDFIQAADDGQVYAIECNPRTHSAITMFYNHPEVAQAYLNPHPLPQMARPLASSRPTYWTYHEVWRLLTKLLSPKMLRQRLQILVNGKDAIFEWDDPLPFLMVHHWQIPLLLLGSFWRGSEWIRIDFNIGKLVELGGD